MATTKNGIHDTILDLLTKSKAIAVMADNAVGNINECERLIHHACSCLDAATAVLDAHADMFNELFELSRRDIARRAIPYDTCYTGLRLQGALG